MPEAKKKSAAQPKPAGKESSPMRPSGEPKSASFHGHFCWNELMAHDVERAKAFYAACIGWTFEPSPMPDGGTYWLIKMPGRENAVGGIFEMNGPHFAGMPEQWVSYVAVDDVDQRLKAAAKAGAQVMREPFDIPMAGRIAILREPGGALVNWMTPRPPAGR